MGRRFHESRAITFTQVVNGWCQGIDGYDIGTYNKKYNPKFGDQFR